MAGDRAAGGARGGVRFRQLTPHEMNQTPDGKFSVSVWRKNKQVMLLQACVFVFVGVVCFFFFLFFVGGLFCVCVCGGVCECGVVSFGARVRVSADVA